MTRRLNRRELFASAAASAGALALARLGLAADGANLRRQPNIVFIFTDDMGYGDLGCYGNEKIATPRIDSLAESGVKFTDFYACSPICTPSRAGFLTGRYPVRFGMGAVLKPHNEGGMPAEELTLAEMLGQAGYATTCIGKWHLGKDEPYLPTNHGFDSYFGIPYSNDMGPDPRDRQKKDWPELPLMRDTEVIEAPVDQSTVTRRYTDEAVKFMKANKDKPFFLYLAHTFPHVPLYASPEHKGKSKRGLYGDVVEEIDESTGRIMDALRDLGLEENTLVVFTSDNGPWLIQGDHAGSADPLKGGKGMSYEGGFRVPCIAHWKGQIKPGRVETQYASMLDWLPTFAALAGVNAPQAAGPIDGLNLLPLLKGQGERKDEPFFYWNLDRGKLKLEAVRQGRWKLKMPKNANHPWWNPQPIKHDLLLFDMQADPEERNNLAAEKPEKVAELQAIAAGHIKALGKLPPNVK